MLLEDHSPKTQHPRLDATLVSSPESVPPRRLSAAKQRGAGVRRRSRLLINLATIAVTLFFSYVALSDIKLGQAWHALRTSDYLWLLPALIAFGLGNLARALRWRSLFAHGRRPPVGAVTNAMMVGYLYNNILPARAGEAARVLVLTKRSSTPAVEIVGTVVLERLYDVLAILVIFFVAEPWLPHVSWFGAAAIVAIALAASIAAAATVLVVYGDRAIRLLLRPLRRLSMFSGDRLERTVFELAHGLSGLRDRRVALEAFLWTTAAWMLSALCAYLVSLAFHLHLPFACGVLVVVAVGLGMILPSPPAAVGVFEGAALIALKAYGVPHSAALPYALVLHAVNFVPFVLIGALLLQYNARRPRRAGRTETLAGATVPS
jgi:glycosyltransferase 2 family protein